MFEWVMMPSPLFSSFFDEGCNIIKTPISRSMTIGLIFSEINDA